MSSSDDFTDAQREAEIGGVPWLYAQGVRLFNDKDFFECHEFLEEIWRHSSYDEARFYQGLIQAAVCFYHWGNANFDGAMRLAKAAKEKLADLPADYMDLELGAFMEEFVPLVEPLFGEHSALKPLPASAAPTLKYAWTYPENDPLLEDCDVFENSITVIEQQR